MTDAPLLDIEGLSVRYGGHTVLHGVDMAVYPGEIVTVVGPNGSGKTTLLKALVGALKPAAGRISRRPRLRTGYVPQRLTLDRAMPLTVSRFLSLQPGVGEAAINRAAVRTGIEDLGGKQMAALSGGQLQRVLLAHALLGEPDLLILDEPAQGLDQPATAAFYRLIEEIRSETGAAVLMVSHDLHVVMSSSDRVICLNGHVCCEGTPMVVSAAPEYRALFGTGTGGAFALYQHAHDHTHGPGDTGHGHTHGPGLEHAHPQMGEHGHEPGGDHHDHHHDHHHAPNRSDDREREARRTDA